MPGKQQIAQGSIAPLYDPAFEHDACGVGLVVNIAGTPSREIVERALGGLVNLTHRGGVGADERTGDGAGVLTQIPHKLFAPILAKQGRADLGPGEYAVAMIFLPQSESDSEAAQQATIAALEEHKLELIDCRAVPIDKAVLGRIAGETLPRIAQLIIAKPADLDIDGFERALLLARKSAERAVEAAGIDGFFVVSISARTIIYKGFCLPQD